MPRVADFTVLTDARRSIGRDVVIPSFEVKFDLDQPHAGSQSILMFNIDLVSANGFGLKVTVNGQDVFTATWSGGEFFSIHEVLPQNLLKTSGNTIVFSATSSSSGSGSARIGDVVIWYQRDI